MNAVLVIGHFVVSVFGFQLGSPVVQYVPYPNIEICQQYATYHNTQLRIDNEYTLVKRAECVSMEEFQKFTGQTPSTE